MVSEVLTTAKVRSLCANNPQGETEVSDEYPIIAKIFNAPNEKFYALWQGQAVCTPTGNLRYFETEGEARLFLAESEGTLLREFAT
jgi:hypothetical protein